MSINIAGTAVGTGVALSNSVRARYTDMYEDEVYYSRLYDQLAVAVPNNDVLIRGSTANFSFLSKMDPGTSAISEERDITPQALRDATKSITPVSRGEALQVSQQIQIQNFLSNYMGKMTTSVAENAAETIDILARDVACQGTLVSRKVARASLDAGTTTHNLTEARMMFAANRLSQLKAPVFEGIGENPPAKRWAAIMSPEAFADFRRDGNIANVGDYQRAGIHLNWELAEYGPYRILVSPWAKIFYGAGLDNAAVVATTLTAATTKMAKTLTVASVTHLDAIVDLFWLSVGTEETANTHYPTNEKVWLTGFTGSTCTIVGEAPNGGMRFDHASGAAVRSADSVHTVVIGGPSSLVKLYAPEVGEFGEIVGPKRDGVLDQFWTLGWKFWGGYGRIAESRLMRIEVSVKADA